MRTALGDLRSGRDALRARLSAPANDPYEAAARRLAASTLVVMAGIADDEYHGFEEAVAVILDGLDEAPEARPLGDVAGLVGAAGELVARWFRSLDDPALPRIAARIVDDGLRTPLDPSLRACAGLAVLSYYEQLRDVEKLLWLELAMRPVLADPALGARLRDEWHCAWINDLYMAGEGARSTAAERARGNVPLVPEVQRKHLLIVAQRAIGDGDTTQGRALLAQAEPLIENAHEHHGAMWHFLASRLAMLDQRLGDALVHARLGLRLQVACGYPERWMGPIVMQEGQVQLARGEHAAAVPFFERAGRAASGAQADYCWCLAHFARALGAAAAGDIGTLRGELASGLALARRLEWIAFLRANPAAASTLCALALEHDIETEFVRTVIATRRLDAARADLAAWPWPVRVRTLGRFEVEVGGTPLVLRGKAAKKPLELLQFLVACGSQQVAAGSVEFALWPDLEGDNAHAASKIALHRLRRLLGDDAAVAIDAGRLSLNPRLVWVDCIAFEALADTVPAAPFGPAHEAAVARALALYAGPFLGSDEDHSWQLVHRERLASKHRRMVRALVTQARTRQDVTLARATLERALELDPLDEDLLRELLRLLAEVGEHGVALGRYERWRALRSRSLGLEPAAATQALAAVIRAAATL